MRRERERIPLEGRSDWVIQVTDDGSRSLLDPSREVSFHSASGAAAETQHVYLKNSGIVERFARGEHATVLEVGLGTGLGLLMTVDHAVTHGVTLKYHAFDLEFLDWEVFSALDLKSSMKNVWIVDSFLDWRRSLGDEVKPGEYRWSLGGQPETISELTTIAAADVSDYQQGLAEPATRGRQIGIEAVVTVGDFCEFNTPRDSKYDAIYFDPFDPSVNPELWHIELLQRLSDCLSRSGALTTYCVSRPVRETFIEAGFAVRRVRGPEGGKREVLIATVAPECD